MKKKLIDAFIILCFSAAFMASCMAIIHFIDQWVTALVGAF
tara:strand:- start:1484 stop:1606 length:123 start_codon:yes stop_codon:yes gene_type:complete